MVSDFNSNLCNDISVLRMKIEQIERAIRQYECAMMWLNDRDVPRHDAEDREYSLIGRIKIALARNDKEGE